MANIAVIGAGTWGMALARMLVNSGSEVTVWSAVPEEIDLMKMERRQKNLPGVALPESISYTKSIEEACRGREMLVFAVPSVFVRSTAKTAAPYIEPETVIVDVAKGIEAGSLKTMTEVIADEIGGLNPLAALSGPTHAEEVAADLPTTIVSASEDEAAARRVQEVFSNSVMRVYTNTDVKGVEICGALKNVIALACGVSAGLGFGDNTKAALMTRGLAEMTRLGVKMGCRQETFAGLAGMGDLIVTATSRHSRNNRCGFLIGQGMKPADAVKEVGMVVEGINAIPAAVELGRKYGVEMPIVAAADEVVNRGCDPREAVTKLMNRDYKPETGT
ncbi:MAG: NAD(P)-dependent glycerol-3-phosphate dehydrogenase [Oscillospiraceae bacterium]|nr:NAD(P)-dependent glycerol-3-phosphate dehydrogenase [Oscillospiraceae bacterium]